jgi:hypothetical protein
MLPLAAVLVGVSLCVAQTMDRGQFETLVAEGGPLAGHDFSGASLPGLEARGLDLSNSNWSGADLRGARFVRCDLEGADLRGASLRGAIMHDSSLAEARLIGTDLSGALLRGINLAGVDMTDCRFDGAVFDQVRLSSNGGSHPPTLTLALRRATGLELSRAWVSGMSGDAFCFVYNTEQPSHWPCRPYYQHPVLAAGRALGVEVQLYHDLPPPDAYARLKQSVRDGLVCMIPVRLVRLQILDAEQQGTWAIVEAIEASDGGDRIELTMPPLGGQRWNEAQLKMNWAGPWPTLHPAGHRNSSGQYPLVTITPTAEPVGLQAQIATATRAAAGTIGDPRSYGPLIPGARGLGKLADDLQLAGTRQDRARMAGLGIWAGYPRSCLAGARAEAQQFLAEAAEVSSEPERAILAEIAALYESQSRLLSDMFPELLPAEQELDPEEQGRRFLHAAELIRHVRAAELRIAVLMEQLQ